MTGRWMGWQLRWTGGGGEERAKLYLLVAPWPGWTSFSLVFFEYRAGLSFILVKLVLYPVVSNNLTTLLASFTAMETSLRPHGAIS